VSNISCPSAEAAAANSGSLVRKIRFVACTLLDALSIPEAEANVDLVNGTSRRQQSVVHLGTVLCRYQTRILTDRTVEYLGVLGELESLSAMAEQTDMVS
jgi:hypothetical protein